MNIKCIKVVTFDATNTLLKFRSPPWQYYAAIGVEYGFEGSDIEIKNCLLHSYNLMLHKYPNFGKNQISWKEWWTQVIKMTFKGRLPPSADINEIAEKLIDDFKTPKCWSKAEGSDRLINILQKTGMCIGVISNFDPRLHEILNNMHFDKAFKFVVTSYESGYCKPNKEIFEHAIYKSGKMIKPLECLHIGDDLEKDYYGAKNAGWHAAIINQNANTEDPTYPPTNHVFRSLDEFSLAIENRKLDL